MLSTGNSEEFRKELSGISGKAEKKFKPLTEEEEIKWVQVGAIPEFVLRGIVPEEHGVQSAPAKACHRKLVAGWPERGFQPQGSQKFEHEWVSSRSAIAAEECEERWEHPNHAKSSDDVIAQAGKQQGCGRRWRVSFVQQQHAEREMMA
ncbi:uncharacterized protein CTHT_0018450 [Thermochaetoides thermophila DSM 1495]|uniref:Uncharacterized protein n=1 Tax=Chaetomium thermophilum (strain DSM 1495 / CBS 144.50 / IMI 039719) TaxID=759272 RepID=G0S2T8_CHATD|nr:hypothetical protein CTHT_0018450 [Thermochaetoides thermophila DSM 1495]EGS22321.1 hypothetical protein CTHT_0018450 [Thermochaetoides thermophila DSM 1495]